MGNIFGKKKSGKTSKTTETYVDPYVKLPEPIPKYQSPVVFQPIYQPPVVPTRDRIIVARARSITNSDTFQPKPNNAVGKSTVNQSVNHFGQRENFGTRSTCDWSFFDIESTDSSYESIPKVNVITAETRKQIYIKPKFTFKLYNPPQEVRSFFNSNFKNTPATRNGHKLMQLIKELISNSNLLTEKNYLDTLELFVEIEELQCENAIKVYSRKSETIRYSDNKNMYIIDVPNLNDSRPAINVYSRLKLTSCELKRQIYGTILEIQSKHIVVEIKSKFDTDIVYNVDFLTNRTTFRMEKLALELMKQKNLVPFMFPNQSKVKKLSIQNHGYNFTWYNKSVAKNLAQQTVIKNIFYGTAYPYPYILFGPPGTGKTTTMVESILQIWEFKTDSRILIVSTSNFACNVISKRLLDFLPISQIFRLFSKSQELVIDKIDNDVLKASNLSKKDHYIPKPNELYQYRIIIATLTTAGRLIQDGFSTDHFTHLFIDECGSCTEGASLIPIAGLISSQNEIKANILIAGDPLQLGPVIQSKYAEKLGYGVSLIERLMEFPLYKKNEQTGNYNTNFITKLCINYRSHKNILHIPNQLFYDNELKALGLPAITNWAINWTHLPNPKFPVLFHAVFGKSLSENDSPSLYNKQEIKMVMSYLKLLVNQNINGKRIKQSDLGVISPYRKQTQKIRAQCDQFKWKNVEVASVEAFQGNEKSVIILSTVRADVDTMGFLNSERRLNVALTRAQACLIIIGDPKVLMRDKCWYQLMKYCYDNNAICGEPFNFYN